MLGRPKLNRATRLKLKRGSRPKLNRSTRPILGARSGKDNGGRETYLSCSSKELVSYVLKNYGEMSTKKCVFWKV